MRLRPAMSSAAAAEVPGGAPRRSRAAPCDHAPVPSDFLPPDPYADAPQERPAFAPPDAPSGAAGAGSAEANRAVLALAAGAAALGLLAFTAGMLFFVTLPASIAGWVLGNQAKRTGTHADQAHVAVIMGVVGTIAGVVATIVWVLIWTDPS
jgi:hypothetical protein